MWVERLKSWAYEPWYPVAIAMISGFNIFTLFLSGPTAALFVAGVLVRPGWAGAVTMAAWNALGTTLGVAAFVAMLPAGSLDTVEASFPSIFEGNGWTRTKGLVESYGVLGAAFASSLPVSLHPVIVFCLLAKMHVPMLLVSILIGRFFKYALMAALAKLAPSLLKRIFRIDVLEAAKAPKKTE